MAEVVKLKTYAAQANESAVRVLEEWLEMAKRGEIIAVAIAGLTADRAAMTHISATDPFVALAGAVSILQHRMLERHLRD